MSERTLYAFDVDNTLWSGHGPVSDDQLTALERGGGVVVIVSPSESDPRGPSGEPKFERIIDAQLDGRTRDLDLLEARRRHPGVRGLVYVDDKLANRVLAETAGFRFRLAAEFAEDWQFETVADHPHDSGCLYLGSDGRWYDRISGACFGAPSELVEILPKESTPLGPVPSSIRISKFAAYRDPRPEALDLDWPHLVELLSCHSRRATYDGPGLGLWSAARYTEGGLHRGGADSDSDVIELSAAVLDLDGVHPDVVIAGLESRGLAGQVHSTYHSGHSRVTVPFSRPCPIGCWPPLHTALSWIAAGLALPYDVVAAGRWYWLPQCPPGASPIALATNGQALDWARLPEIVLTPPYAPTQFVRRRKPVLAPPQDPAAEQREQEARQRRIWGP